MRWINSLRGRLVLVMAVVFSLGAVNVGIYLFDLDHDVRDHVFKEQIDILVAGLPHSPGAEDIDRLPLKFSESYWRYSLYAKDGTLLASRPPEADALAFLTPEDLPADLPSTMAARRVGEGRVLVFGRNDWDECEELCQIFRARMTGSVTVIGILACVSLLSIYLLLSWALASVRRAAVLAGTIGKDTPGRRIPLDALPEEILPLVVSANTALDRLAEAYALERRFTADAAHELRTPLTVLDLRLQKAATGTMPDWPAIRRDMDQMRYLLDQLLELAQLDHGAAPQADPVPLALARVIRQAVADVLPAYEEAGRPLEIEVGEGIFLEHGAGQLRQAIRSLLVNALKHGQGRVLVTLTTPQKHLAEIRVADEGAAASPRDAELMFERFRKGRQNQSGAGLGLSIVRQVMANLGGTARIATGGSFCVILTVPLTQGRDSVSLVS